MNIKLSKLVSEVLGGLEKKPRQILEARFGLRDGQAKTLAEIGESFKVTRERVRQVEKVAMGKTKELLLKGGGKQFLRLVEDHLKNVGGVRREDLLLADLRFMLTDPQTQFLANKVQFLLEVAGEPKLALADKDSHSYWYLTAEDQKKTSSFLGRLVKLMETNREKVVTHKDVDAVMNEAVKPHNLKDVVALNYVSTSKKFHVNEYGDFGLSEWPEVKPQTIREWAYLVLKKNQKPLHFEDIATMINKVRKVSVKRAHPQTVHNELIKDARFVLVGRGTYGLQEFGLVPGNAQEVMARLLKKHGSLRPDELLNLVLQERVLKKNTIFINLQNKKHFKRLEDGRYTTLV